MPSQAPPRVLLPQPHQQHVESPHPCSGLDRQAGGVGSAGAVRGRRGGLLGRVCRFRFVKERLHSGDRQTRFDALEPRRIPLHFWNIGKNKRLSMQAELAPSPVKQSRSCGRNWTEENSAPWYEHTWEPNLPVFDSSALRRPSTLLWCRPVLLPRLLSDCAEEDSP